MDKTGDRDAPPRKRTKPPTSATARIQQTKTTPNPHCEGAKSTPLEGEVGAAASHLSQCAHGGPTSTTISGP